MTKGSGAMWHSRGAESGSTVTATPARIFGQEQPARSFPLVDVLVALVIVGTLLGLAIPQFIACRQHAAYIASEITLDAAPAMDVRHRHGQDRDPGTGRLKGDEAASVKDQRTATAPMHQEV